MNDTPHADGAPHNAAVHPALREDVNFRAVIWFAIVLAVVVGLVFLGIWGMFVFLQGREDQEKRSHYPLSADQVQPLSQTEFGAQTTGVLPPAPRLENLDLGQPAVQKSAEEEQRLQTTGSEDGRAHLSIEQAMRLVADDYKVQGHEPAPVRYDAGIPGTGGGSNSGRDLPEAKR